MSESPNLKARRSRLTVSETELAQDALNGVQDSLHRVSSRFANLYIRPHWFRKAGDKHRGHLHQVDHVTVLVRGSIHVKYTFSDGSTDEAEYTTHRPGLPDQLRFIEISKNVFHQLTALEDDTMYCCVFSTAGIASHAEAASMQAGLCDECVDGSGCSQLADMIAFGDGSRVA